MYGLPQAGRLANILLKRRLAKDDYYETKTPGLWTHTFRPIWFTLIVDDFGVKFINTENADHLIKALRKHYIVEINWEGKKYCGITLNWDYDKRTVDASIPGYVETRLAAYEYPKSNKKVHTPFPPTTDKHSQEPVATDESPKINEKRKKRIERIIGTFLYYSRAVDETMLKTLNMLSTQQAKPTETTEKHVNHFLQYCATHPNATIRYYASDMLLRIHLDASYMNETKARSTAGGHFWLGYKDDNERKLKRNGPIYMLYTLIKLVCASAAEAELAALFLNIQEGIRIKQALELMGHKQPPIIVEVCAVFIYKNNVNKYMPKVFKMICNIFSDSNYSTNHKFNIYELYLRAICEEVFVERFCEY